MIYTTILYIEYSHFLNVNQYQLKNLIHVFIEVFLIYILYLVLKNNFMAKKSHQ